MFLAGTVETGPNLGPVRRSEPYTSQPMKTKLILLPLGLALLGAGCVGTGPNTQQGAVSGSVLGAIAGAVIGNNSGHGNGGQGALIGAAAGAMLGGTMGNQVDHQNGTIYGSEREATTPIQVEAPPPPPPPRETVIVERPEPESVWIEGHWEYDGRGYYWVDGYWVVPPPHYRHYVAPHWERRGHVHVYIRGYWRL
jgi:hypothetical protein